MKKNKSKNDFLDHLRKVPIVQVACEKSGLSRNTVYRWRKEDPDFLAEMDSAFKEGEEFVNDMSETQLFTLIKEKSFPAIRFWLNKRSERFKDKVEVTTKIADESLSPEQEAIVREALRLSNITSEIYDTRSNN